MPSAAILTQPSAPPRPRPSVAASTTPPAPPRPRTKRGRATSQADSQRPPLSAKHSVLGSYTDPHGRPREVLAQAGVAGSVLVIDRDLTTHGDRRLVAHLGADEPTANATLICRDYLRSPEHRWCRSLTAEDLQMAPFAERRALKPPPTRSGLVELLGGAASAQPAAATPAAEVLLGGAANAHPTAATPATQGLLDHQGRAHRLLAGATGMSIPELRWHRSHAGATPAPPEPLGLREVIATLESYEPARTLTTDALSRYRDDPCISTYTLGAELERLDASRIVLNRGLREAVQAATASGSLSMSEITIRCGRLKRGMQGESAGGDTSWLARRIGLMPEGGRSGIPTPWVHSEVLALIARQGLGISPREVELG